MSSLYNMMEKMTQHLVVLVLCMNLVPANALNQPPSIYREAARDIYFKSGETVEMPCNASGFPKIAYKWKRNGVYIDVNGYDDRMVMFDGSGTIVINKAEDKDEGIFQCFAVNELGTSTSDHIHLREAKLIKFPLNKTITLSYNMNLGSPLTLNCVPPTSVPKAEMLWVLKDSSGRMDPIHYNNRITMDLEARLRITNVKREDYQNGRAYVCVATNHFLRSHSFDHGYYINPVGINERKSSPSYMWSSPSYTFGLVGERFQMKCIFSGNPTPEVHWEKKNETLRSEIQLFEEGKELIIPHLQLSDAGRYTCYGNNTLEQRASRDIWLTVEAKPYWVTKPHNIETSEGGKATFICEAAGIPMPKISWYVNGVPLDESNDDTVNSDRFLRPDEMTVTIVDLRLTDVFVIQCNCSNYRGYVFEDVYLNVLYYVDELFEELLLFRETINSFTKAKEAAVPAGKERPLPLSKSCDYPLAKDEIVASRKSNSDK